MARKTKESSDYIKIRKYILQLARQSGGSAVPLPTNVELAGMFGVSRPTVSKAIGQLIRDGYVTARRGIGSFTNPGAGGDSGENRMVGLLIGDGMYVWYDEFMANLYGRMLQAFSGPNILLQPVSLSARKKEELDLELESMNFDALICWHPREEALDGLRRLPELRKKTIVLDKKVTGFAGIVPDYEKLGFEIGTRMLRDGIRKPVFLDNHEPWNLPLRGLKKAFRDNGFPLNSSAFLSREESDAEHILRLDGADAVFFPTSRTERIREITRILEENGRPLPFAANLFCMRHFPGARGYFYDFQEDEQFRKANGLLQEILRKGTVKPVCEFQTISIVEEGVRK